MKMLVTCVLLFWPLVQPGVCVPLKGECLDCRLVRMACTDKLRNERCSCNPREVCCNNCCGGQNCVPRKSGSTCPDGSNPVNCLVSPCQSASCFAYPDATCIDNYCGGCNADWYVGGKLVDCNELQEECLDCRLVLMACTDELRNERCRCNSREVCCNNCCGGQHCVPKKSECPDGSDPVYCFVRPCQFATKCEAYPEATCVDNYCGGCNRDWFVDGKLVNCDVCTMPLVSGPCRGSFRRWGYCNGRCRRFTYGGCKGNGNRFSTKGECLAACRWKGGKKLQDQPLGSSTYWTRDSLIKNNGNNSGT